MPIAEHSMALRCLRSAWENKQTPHTAPLRWFPITLNVLTQPARILAVPRTCRRTSLFSSLDRICVLILLLCLAHCRTRERCLLHCFYCLQFVRTTRLPATLPSCSALLCPCCVLLACMPAPGRLPLACLPFNADVIFCHGLFPTF